MYSRSRRPMRLRVLLLRPSKAFSTKSAVLNGAKFREQLRATDASLNSMKLTDTKKGNMTSQSPKRIWENLRRDSTYFNRSLRKLMDYQQQTPPTMARLPFRSPSEWIPILVCDSFKNVVFLKDHKSTQHSRRPNPRARNPTNPRGCQVNWKQIQESELLQTSLPRVAPCIWAE